MKKKESVKIIPLGGVGEIGKNMYVYECGEDMVVVDCGCIFPDAGLIGVEKIVQDCTYVIENAEKLKGIIITHAHEDHVSGLPYLLRQVEAPVFATKLCAEIAKVKLRDAGQDNMYSLINTITEDTVMSLGCFGIEFIHVNHSVPESLAVVLFTPQGTIIHTGDFRVDFSPVGYENPFDLPKLSRYGDEGVRALVCESTNAMRPGFSPSEQIVLQEMDDILTKFKTNRLILSVFSTNLNRIISLMQVIKKHGRKVAFMGKSMERMEIIAQDLGYFSGVEDIVVDMYEAAMLPPEKIFLFSTGSQGEVMSALKRLADNSYSDLELEKEDIVILSSSVIPGNEKNVSAIVNSLMAHDIKVLRAPEYCLHVSGHAYAEEMKLIASLARPEYFIPVHGEIMHLKANASNMIQMGFPEDNIVIPGLGSVVELSDNGIKCIDTVPAGSVPIETNCVSNTDEYTMAERKKLMINGILIIMVRSDFNRQSGTTVRDPMVFTKGVSFTDADNVTFNIKRLAKVAVQDNIVKARLDIKSARTQLVHMLYDYIASTGNKVPMITPILVC